MNLGDGVHLTYCTNVHPGESWAEVRSNFDRYVLAVRDRLGVPGDFGVGLRLSARAAAELSDRYVTDRALYAVQEEARAAGRGLWADR